MPIKAQNTSHTMGKSQMICAKNLRRAMKKRGRYRGPDLQEILLNTYFLGGENQLPASPTRLQK